MYSFMAPKQGSVRAMAAPQCFDSEGNSCYAHREADGSWVCFC